MAENETKGNSRPDYRVDVHDNYQYIFTNLFGEVKTKKALKQKGELTKDLFRLGMFAHGTVRSKKLKAAMVCQAVEFKFDFYLMEAKEDHFLLLVFLESIVLPSVISKLDTVVLELEKMLHLSKVYKKMCFLNDSVASSCGVDEAISYDVICDAVTNKKDRKRQCVISYA